ncbi:MAG TPA: SAM-dependent methyltransferase, partial [Pyrinomonadaceae bacterium]
MSSNHKEQFIEALSQSLDEGFFVKLSLGKYRGEDANLQKILIRLIQTKKGTRLFFLYRYNTRDMVKNYAFDEGTRMVREMLGSAFMSAHLFTTQQDVQIEFSKKSKSRLNASKPTFQATPATVHNREKRWQIEPRDNFYLKALGVTDDKGEIKERMGDKWKQINKFIEIIGKLFDSSALSEKQDIRIVDMGAGKGYLTFATYDYFNHVRGIKAQVTGVDAREELVSLCNDIARAADFEGLEFQRGLIRDYEIGETDILIALHACNTATDEAIYKGIAARASVIICAPCCHQQIRPQIVAPSVLHSVLRHGIMLEREAEIATDGLRSLLLEQHGYATKVFEFISTEHTQKNTMIVGVRREQAAQADDIARQIAELKNFYGIKEHHLETLLT